MYKCLDFRLFNDKNHYIPFQIYPLKKLTAKLEFFFRDEWVTVFFLKNKEIKIICSFYYFNYGTMILSEVYAKEKYLIIYKTINCPANSTNLLNCKVDTEM